MREVEVIERLRRIATAPEARGLLDDVALLDGLVITHDSIAEGVHFLSEDPPASVGWKLVAVNLSDLAAKGATPAGALLSLTLSGDGSWDSEFLTGVEHACESYELPLIGGDTIALPEGAPRVLGLTAIGRAGPNVPDRSGGRHGDVLWIVGTVGDSAAGLAQLRDDARATGPLVDIYRRPVPQLGAGQVVAPRSACDDGHLRWTSPRREQDGQGKRMHCNHRPRCASTIQRICRGTGLRSEGPHVRCLRGRRLCAAGSASLRARPGNAFFTTRDEDQPYRDAGRW